MNPDVILKVSITETVKEEFVKNPYDLVGLKYKVKDNSYGSEIVNGKRMPYHIGLYNQVVKIISNSYITTVKSVLGEDVKQRMIKVKSFKTGLVYEVMFNESWIED